MRLDSLAKGRDWNVERVPLSELKPYGRNARRHGKKQVTQIAASMRQFGFAQPLLVDRDNCIIAGHGRLEAARELGLEEVPVIRLEGLTEAQVAAYRIADNRLAELSDWDPELLSQELISILGQEFDFPLEVIGFEGDALDRLLDPHPPAQDADDLLPQVEERAVSRLHDTFLCGDHRLRCDNALEPLAYTALMAGEKARQVITDPPYNVRIAHNVTGLGRRKHREFVMGSGEMGEGFTDFLATSLGLAAAHSIDGAIHGVFIDWRHMVELKTAGDRVYSEMKNLIVWKKTTAGMGTFYRSQHELVFLFKVGTAPHINTFGLGEGGRYRTNCWEYPGVNGFGRDRDDALDMHPTVKPVAMIADAIRDVTRRRDIVLDPFGGSGTTLIAAQKTGRRARLLELDPLYIDVICRRWAAFSGQEAILEETGETFSALTARRAQEAAHV